MAQHTNSKQPPMGVILAVLGCLLMLLGLATTIWALTRPHHADVAIRAITVSPASQDRDAGRVILMETTGLSLWLRVQGQPLKSSPLTISAALVQRDGRATARVRGTLGKDPVARSQDGHHHDYLIGALEAPRPLAGRLRYRITGLVNHHAHSPSKGFALVIRRSPPFVLPLPELTLALAGLGLGALGLRRLKPRASPK